jgi:hypothetical protein
MSRSAAEATLGQLTCHPNKEGYEVCRGAQEQIGDIRHLEVYLYRDCVISASYEGLAPPNVWDALNNLIARYGKPTLSGARERDSSGRLHEIYGWKDDRSLYSVRFMWRNTEAGNPELAGTVTALWDRKGYNQWEGETHQRGAPGVHEPEETEADGSTMGRT